jgi:hypothetical protein
MFNSSIRKNKGCRSHTKFRINSTCFPIYALLERSSSMQVPCHSREASSCTSRLTPCGAAPRLRRLYDAAGQDAHPHAKAPGYLVHHHRRIGRCLSTWIPACINDAIPPCPRCRGHKQWWCIGAGHVVVWRRLVGRCWLLGSTPGAPKPWKPSRPSSKH